MTTIKISFYCMLYKSGQVWEHFAAPTFLLHSLCLFRAIARSCAGPIDHSFI